MLKDEHQALQLAFASLEEKLRKTQVFNIRSLLSFLCDVYKKYTKSYECYEIFTIHCLNKMTELFVAISL